MQSGPTELEQRVLEFLRRAMDERGDQIEVREVADALGLSIDRVERLLASLRRKGELRENPHAPTGLELPEAGRPPRDGAPAPAGGLTAAQRRVYDAYVTMTAEAGHGPTYREVAARLGLALSTVHSTVARLRRRGRLVAQPSMSRAVRAAGWSPPAPATPGTAAAAGTVYVATTGLAAAGPLRFAAVHDDGLPVPVALVGRRDPAELFLVEVHGDSMCGEGMRDGDLVVARVQDTASNGDLVVAEAVGPAGPDGADEGRTVKRLRVDGNGTEQLEAANPDYPPIPAEKVRIIGVVVALMRRYSQIRSP